jgi:Uma2 family endonuclease
MYNRLDMVPVVYETEPLLATSELGPYRDADYMALPDEPRCELLYGRLLVTPAPTIRHQRVAVRIIEILIAFANRIGGEAFCAPVDVVLADHSIVQPDAIYVSPARSSILRNRAEGAPDLAVEILSPGTARRDLGPKLRLYADSGVREYWIVDPNLRTFTFLENDGNGFRVRSPEGTLYRSSAIAGLELDVEAFWRTIPTDSDR